MARQGFYYGGYPWQEWGILTAKDLDDAIGRAANSGIPEAPMDGNAYVRRNGAWEPVIAGNNGGRASPISIYGNSSVAPVADGSIYVFNSTDATLHITLAPGTFVDQQILVKDAGGNAGTYNIEIDTSNSIDGNANYTIYSDFGSVSLVWLGNMWGTM